MTNEFKILDSSSKLDQVVVISHGEMPAEFLLQAQVIFNEVKVFNIDINSLSSIPVTCGASFFIIDQLILEESCDKEKLVLTLKIPTLFIDLKHNVKTNEIANSYCWLNWPCETSEFRNKLAFSAYKIALRTKLVEENKLLQSAMACVGNILIYLDDHGDTLDCNEQAKELLNFDKEQFVGKPWYYLLQIKRDLAAKQIQQFIAAAIKSKAVTKIQPLALNSLNLLDGIIGPIEYSDGSSGAVLIFRKLAQVENVQEVLTVRGASSNSEEVKNSSNILLITPDNFSHVNQQYDWNTGDLVLNEIELRIQNVVRATDLIVRYSGVSFMLLLYDTKPEQTHNLLNQLMNALVKKSYLDNNIAMTFSFGVALNNELVDYSPIELFYFANFSLSQAQELGGNQSRQWAQQSTLQQIGNFDRVNGCFLGKGTADYQKMLKFWIILNELGKFDNKEDFIQTFSHELLTTFDLINVAFFMLEKDQLSLLCCIDKNNEQQCHTCEQVTLSKHQQMYIDQITNHYDDDVMPFTSILEVSGIEVLVPIKTDGHLIGLLKIKGSDEQELALRDHSLISKIASYVALTIDKLEHESKCSLSDSIDTQASKGDMFWYSSSEMKRLIQEVAMVAPTNATVLITGESGTGKELLAQKVHELSDRKDKAFVIFDCGSVVESLIESELFGHVKGAFTGADKAFDGCIEQAKGGTIFLDEIGELPIHIQVKLLRFVQEKQYSQVGGVGYRSADVRVVAATNVDLEMQIKKGLFREDLYYRLNVFKIESPPLRKRNNDILLIAENYLRKYSAEYGKKIFGFKKEAKQAIMQYNWPGNIRELKNLIHRASILCRGNWIECSHLGLYPSENRPNITPVQSQRNYLLNTSIQEDKNFSVISKPFNKAGIAIINKFEELIAHEDKFQREATQMIPPSSIRHSSQIWQELVSEFITLRLNNSNINISLTTLFEKELYKIGLDKCQQITLQAATKLNIAESTFRRRWKILQVDETIMPSSISSKVHLLVQLVFEEDTEDSKITVVQHQLVKACVALGVTSKVGTKLFKVSLATYRNLVKQTIKQLDDQLLLCNH